MLVVKRIMYMVFVMSFLNNKFMLFLPLEKDRREEEEKYMV